MKVARVDKLIELVRSKRSPLPLPVPLEDSEIALAEKAAGVALPPSLVRWLAVDASWLRRNHCGFDRARHIPPHRAAKAASWLVSSAAVRIELRIAGGTRFLFRARTRLVLRTHCACPRRRAPALLPHPRPTIALRHCRLREVVLSLRAMDAQCMQCGAFGDDEAPCANCGTRVDPNGVRYVSFTLMRDHCVHCGAALPILGPLRSITCSACQKATPIEAIDWGPLLVHAVHGFDSWNQKGHSLLSSRVPRAVPACASCSTPMPLEKLPIGVDTTTTCACGAPLTAFPPPPWLKEELPALLQLYGAERETTAGEAIPVNTRGSAPIVMACPKCGAALSLTAESQRTTACTFCQASVYLPDDLWRSLHPVKTARAWSFAYQGKLQSRAARMKAEEERARKEADAADRIKKAQEHNVAARAREEEKALEDAARRRVMRKRAILAYGILGLAAIAALVFTLLLSKK